MQIQACFQNKPSCCLIISSCKQIVCLPSRCSQTFRWWTSLCVSCRGRWRPTCRPSTSSWDKTTTSVSCPPSSTRCWRAWWQSSTLHSSSHREHRYTHAHTHTLYMFIYINTHFMSQHSSVETSVFIRVFFVQTVKNQTWTGLPYLQNITKHFWV